MTFGLFIVIGLIVLGLLVFIHELGHFLAAKWLKFKVVAFSIGFGTPLLKKTIGETEYRLSAIPFGGYVKMAGDSPSDELTGDKGEFLSKPAWQRAVVAFAGPAANFVSAIGMLWLVYILGTTQPIILDNPVLGQVPDSTAAKESGLTKGDTIKFIDKKAIKNWEDIQNLFSRQQRQYTIIYNRHGTLDTAVLRMTYDGSIPKEPLGGLRPMPMSAVIGKVNPNSPAEKAGLNGGDTVKTINGKPVNSWEDLVKIIRSDSKDGQALAIMVNRSSGQNTFTVKPEYYKSEKRYVIGVNPEVKTVKYSAGPAFDMAMKKSWEYTVLIFDVVGKLISTEVPVSQLSGPVGIIPASGMIALQGLTSILNFMALIGINLAVLNLMPLVITDGGVLLFLLIEVIRRKPLTLKTQLLINKVAIAFFLFLFLIVTFNDIKRLPDFFNLMK